MVDGMHPQSQSEQQKQLDFWDIHDHVNYANGQHPNSPPITGQQPHYNNFMNPNMPTHVQNHYRNMIVQNNPNKNIAMNPNVVVPNIPPTAFSAQVYVPYRSQINALYDNPNSFIINTNKASSSHSGKSVQTTDNTTHSSQSGSGSEGGGTTSSATSTTSTSSTLPLIARSNNGMSKLTQRFGYERVMNSNNENVMFGGQGLGMGMMGQSGPACYTNSNVNVNANNNHNIPLNNHSNNQFHNANNNSNNSISSSMYPNFNNPCYNNNSNMNSEAKRQRLENNMTQSNTESNNQTNSNPIILMQPNNNNNNNNINSTLLQVPDNSNNNMTNGSANTIKENMLIRIMSSNSLSNLTMTRSSSFNDFKFDALSDFDYSIGLGEKLFGSSNSLVGLGERAEAIIASTNSNTNVNTNNNNNNNNNVTNNNNNNNNVQSTNRSDKNGPNNNNNNKSSMNTMSIDFNALKSNGNYPVRHLGDEDGNTALGGHSQPSNAAIVGMRSLCMSNNKNSSELSFNNNQMGCGMKKSKSYETMGSSGHSSSDSTAPLSSDGENNRECVLTEKDDFEFLRLLGHC